MLEQTLYNSKIMKTITYEQFEEQYKPIKNTLVEDSPYNGCMFGTYGAELAHVREQDIKNIWTLIDAENEETFIVPGYSYVDRLGYFITEKEWESEDIEVNDNEMISIGKAKYLCKEFVEEELGILFTDEMEDKLHDYYSQL